MGSKGTVDSVGDGEVGVKWGDGSVSEPPHPLSAVYPYDFGDRPTPKATRYSFTVFFKKKGLKRKRSQSTLLFIHIDITNATQQTQTPTS